MLAYYWPQVNCVCVVVFYYSLGEEERMGLLRNPTQDTENKATQRQAGAPRQFSPASQGPEGVAVPGASIHPRADSLPRPAIDQLLTRQSSQ